MGRSRAELLRIAEQRIAGLVDDDPARSAVVPYVLAMLEQIVLDGQPTPQPTAYEDGIEVAWLANNWYVGLIVTIEDGWTLWGEQPDHTELFTAEGPVGVLLRRDTLRWTQHLLESMGDQIADSGMWKV